MGVKDHLEDGTGHTLSLGLDLDYLHVDGAERQGSLSATAGAGNVRVRQVRASAPSNSDHSSISGRSSCSNLSEESAVSDSDEERLQNGSREDKTPHLQESFSKDQTVRRDLAPNISQGDPGQQETSVTDPASEYSAKVKFALKLGYSEELVVPVLRKLGPDALINDILGELVKLGTKAETEQRGGLTTSQSSPSASLDCSSSSSSLSSDSSLVSSWPAYPSKLLKDIENLRPIVVDGSNVAMSHGNKEAFSCQGIQLAVDWFLERGHRDITVFVPAWRKEQSRPDALITDQEILRRLEKDKILVFTPSRRVQGRRVVCYDDRFIVKLAYESDGIIVSNDNYRDLANEKPEWKKFIDERLLMYSFVNDKFMPPDDPLGRHGPSLENFLRKRPIIPEHRKQPCPYAKKCTYGHKCKFYHPERGSQPQRAVADELRASAKISSRASKSLLEDALMVKCQSPSQAEGRVETNQSWETPKKEPNPGPQNLFSDLLEDRLRGQSKVEGRRGSSSSGSGSSCSSSSSSSSILGHLTSGGAPSSGSLDQWEHSGGSSGRSSRVTGASGPGNTPQRCESPDTGYSSLVKAYSSLSLVVPQSPECFFPADLRAGSLLSDCSSEGSVSSDSFSPDPALEDVHKCHHHHHHYPHRHHHCSGQYAHAASHVPPGLGQHSPIHRPIPQALRRTRGFGSDDSLSSVTSHAPPRAAKPPPAYFTPQPQNPMLSSFSGEFQPFLHRPPQASTAYSFSQSSPLRCSAMGSTWDESGLQGSQVYKGSPLHLRRTHPDLNPQTHHQMNWEPHYQQSPNPHYDPFTLQNLPEAIEKAWPSPWGRQPHFSPRGLSASSPSPLPLPSLPPITSHRGHVASPPKHQEPPDLGRYQELRERMFVNLSSIFSPDLVRTVMTRNPHVMDAQKLAAAILMEKSQHGS